MGIFHRCGPHPLAAVVILLFLAGTAGPAAAEWNGTGDINLGDKVTAEFKAGGFPEAHQYSFFAVAGTKLSASLKVGKGADLVPQIGLFKSTGAPVDLGASLSAKNPQKPKIKKFVFAESGWFYLQVLPTTGKGVYTLKAKGKPPKKVKATEASTGTKKFSALAGTLLTATIKRAKGSAANPTMTGLIDPDGNAVGIGGDTTKLKKFPLPTSGTWTLVYRNDGAAGNVSITLSLKAPKSKQKLAKGAQDRMPIGVVDAGDPFGAAAAGYVGSNACRTCHPEEFTGVVNSLHNSKLRSTFREGGAGYVIPPVFDAMFKAGTDLTTDPAFAALTGLAVSYVAGDALPYKITVGGTTYDVMFVMGGNGLWKQRYVVKIGNSHYISPIQYNEKSGTFAGYHTSDWFDAGGVALPTKDPNSSWERRCGACHSTGVNLSYDAASGEYRTGYAQLNIGCEACHGPGEAHLASENPADILNPRDLLDGTVEGVQKAALTCGQCHQRGDGGTPTGAPKGTGYPWKEGGSIFPPGNLNMEEYYTRTGASAFWEFKDNPLGFAPTADFSDDTFVASKSHHQQYLDVWQGPHAPDKTYDGVCFDCHDAHGRKKRMVAETMTRHEETFTDIENDNNKLCLVCHMSYGDFENVTKADVDAITNDFAPATVVNAVVDHMKDKAGMPVHTGDYSPASGSKAGRCSKCHMPKMAKSAEYGTDAAGNPVGDIHTHTFWPVWPSVTFQTDGAITNSCNVCHPLDPADEADDIIAAWASDPDEDGTFHADTPRNFQTGVANDERDGGVACAACHTTDGFVAIQVNGTNIHDLTGDADADARKEFVHAALARDKGITCEACHGKQPDGTFAAGDNPLRFPKADLCGKCHNNETVLMEDYRDHGEIVRHPQREMLAGVDGGEVPAMTYGNTAHSGFANKCVTCHYDVAKGGEHTFEPKLEACKTCHAGLADFNRPAFGDYDGDGLTGGIQDEVNGALKVLEDAIVAAVNSTGAVITYDGHYFQIDDGVTKSRGNTAALDSVLDAALIRAMFNHYWVSFDASGGIHNAKYTLQLIQKSYTELTGDPWPGDVK